MITPCKTRHECLEWLRANPKSVALQQDVVVDLFRPEDAEGVARLYHAVYGDTFPLDYVYDPVSIREANEGPDLHQIVARNESEDIVGLSALFRVSPGEGLMESGALMILPEYRLGMLIFRLIDRTQKLARTLGLNATFGQSVTDHLTTQKINRKYGFSAFAFEIESMPPRPDGGRERISFLDEFIVFTDIAHTVFLPDAYGKFFQDMYAKAKLERTFHSGVNPKGDTVFTTMFMDTASQAKLMVTEIGADFSDVIHNLEKSHPECYAYHLLLPLTHQGLPAAVNEARKQGYCLGGLLPLWTDRDVLLMQKVAGEPDFSVPLILTEQAQKLVKYIRMDWESLKVK